MNDTKYFNQLRTLSEELFQAGTAHPYDPDAYNDIVNQLNRLYSSRGKRKRQIPWIMIIVTVVWLVALALIVYSILCQPAF